MKRIFEKKIHIRIRRRIQHRPDDIYKKHAIIVIDYNHIQTYIKQTETLFRTRQQSKTRSNYKQFQCTIGLQFGICEGIGVDMNVINKRTYTHTYALNHCFY